MEDELSELYRLKAPAACPACLLIAAVTEFAVPSCQRFVFVLTPHSGVVRIQLPGIGCPLEFVPCWIWSPLAPMS